MRVGIVEPVDGRWSADKGRGLVALEDIGRGDCVMKGGERPCVAMQHMYSRRCGLNCATCFKWIGHITQHFNEILRNVDKSIEFDFPDCVTLLDTIATYCPKLPQPIYCPRGGLCREVFCSPECLQGSSLTPEWHNRLCVMRSSLSDKSTDRQTAAQQFRRHSMKYHESFLLAARAYSQLLSKLEIPKNGVKEFLDQLQIYKSLDTKPWHTLPLGLKVEGGLFAEQPLTSEHRFMRASESFHLLQLMFVDSLAPGIQFEEVSIGNAIKQINNLDFYLKLLGTFEIVNVNVEFENPFNKSLIQFLTEKLKDSCAYKPIQPIAANSPYESPISPLLNLLLDIRSIVKCEESNTGEFCEEIHYDSGSNFNTLYHKNDKEKIEMLLLDDIFPDFCGIGLYHYVAMTNHSCCPNIVPDFPLQNFVCIASAIRNILAGDEITQSYIDEELPLAARQRKLKTERGFVCRCPKCLQEARMLLQEPK